MLNDVLEKEKEKENLKTINFGYKFFCYDIFVLGGAQRQVLHLQMR